MDYSLLQQTGLLRADDDVISIHFLCGQSLVQRRPGMVAINKRQHTIHPLSIPLYMEEELYQSFNMSICQWSGLPISC